MKLVVFLLIFISTGAIKLTRVNGKPAGIYEEISLSDDILKVKKREDSSRVYLEQCGIVKFPNARRGVVNVLAFLDSSWPYSHRQAIMLEMLNSRLRKSDLTNILFFVVNVNPYFPRKIDTTEDDIEREAWLGVSPDEIEGFARINKTFDSLASSMNPGIELIQDNEELGIWKLLGGSRDQVLVIDRCGKLTYQVIVPWSILHFPYVKAAILSTYNDQPCGVCNFIGNSELPGRLQSTSTMGSVAETVIVDSTRAESPFKENFVSSSDNPQTESTTLVSIFYPNTDMTIVPDSTFPNLIDETGNPSMERRVTEKYKETTTETSTIGFENEISTLEIENHVTTVFPEVDTSGSGEFITGITGRTLNYKSSIFEEQNENSGSQTPEVIEQTTEEMPDLPLTEIANASLEDLFDFGSKNADYATMNINEATNSDTLIDNFVNTTTEAIFDKTEVRVFENELTTKMAGSRLDSAEDSIGLDAEAMKLSTPNNYETTEAKEDDNIVFTTMEDISESNTPEILSLEEKSQEINDLSTTPEISKKNEENDPAASYVPIRIIMHAPHFHVDVDSTRMHEYLVIKTGSSDTHEHLASHDATRLYNGPQDHQEINIADSAAEEIEHKKWPMKNLIFTKDESTGLFGEVADYWRDLSNLETYDELEETERPDNERIYEQGPTDEKLWNQSSTGKNENLKTATESLAAEAASEIITEVQPISRTEEFNSEEEETRNRLIAHYSKLLPWIYYVLDK